MKKKMDFKREFSAGGVVYKKSKVPSTSLRAGASQKFQPEAGPPLAEKVEFLLGKHSGYHKWVLPKGLIEEGEKGWQTALRETEEEMGVKARLVSEKPIHKETYFYVADLKKQSQISNDKPACRTGRFLISNKIPNSKFPSFAKAMEGKQNSRPKDDQPLAEKLDRSTRRVMVYQEEGGGKTRVFKTVTFYLLEYENGSPEDYGWEMEEADWFDYEGALKLMAFKGEKEALKKAEEILESGGLL